MPDSSSGARYVELTQRMNVINGVGAGLVSALMLVETWGSWHAFGLIATGQLGLIVFNTFGVNKTLLPRWGVRRAEVFRTVVNIGASVLINHFAHWPLAAWLFLPFVALVFDHLGRRVTWLVLVLTSAVQTSMSLWDGVSWHYPLVFTTFAFFCSAVSEVRFRAMRGMLADADTHRRALASEINARHAAEQDLRRAQKLEAIGRLTAGVAHEINTPLQFVGDNLTFLETSLETLAAHYRKVRTLVEEPALRSLEEEADIDFLLREMPRAVADSCEGTASVSRMVRAMKAFAHVDPSETPKLFDLDAALRDVVAVAHNETKYVADVVLELGQVESVVGLQGDLKQVFLNLLVNAAHAVSDAGKTRGKITVRTRSDGRWAVVEIADTGVGIARSVRDLVFDPFFTTKEVGRGSGQGLAIARAIVVNKHGGELTFKSEVGRGTTFFVRIPLHGRSQDETGKAA